MNACWYYRPEQTVHRFDKHFYENEVVKTGQYRDHRIEDVEDRCFVMFITRYPRGRPRGLPPDKAVYVCESRYNEEKFKFNKIKTWTSCLPDEVREKDYEMDLFDVPRNLRKVPSPIKHLLQADAKETDDLPKPTWRSPNAPPLIGAVHRRPREPNVSLDFPWLPLSVCLPPDFAGFQRQTRNPALDVVGRIHGCACQRRTLSRWAALSRKPAPLLSSGPVRAPCVIWPAPTRRLPSHCCWRRQGGQGATSGRT